MKNRSLLFKIVVLTCLSIAAYIVLILPKDQSSLPVLNNGDIIFQTNFDPQAYAVTAATLSLYTHTGIIKKSAGGYTVVEAADIVRETPLTEWIARGWLKRFAVYRHQYLRPQQGYDLIEALKKYYGRSYDIWFYPSDREIYCSELPYLAFGDIGMSVGAPQKVGSLYVNNSFVRWLIERRWQTYPGCTGQNVNFDQCYDIIMETSIITPLSIADDKNLELIFTNYHL